MDKMAAISGKCAGEPTPSAVKELIRRKWPEALLESTGRSGRSFVTGLENFDRLFPSGGIPYGQLVEITGEASCGKTGLLFHVLAGLVKQVRVGYVDAGNTFFPGAASACGVDLERLIAVKPKNMLETMRTTELLLRHRLVGCVVCDLVGQAGMLSLAWCHRLRTRTVRAKGLVIFVTENNSQIIPPSMTSLRLEVTRKDTQAVAVTVAKSRVSPEGASAEVVLHGA